MAITREYRRARIKKRVRKVVSGSDKRPRLTVFRSNKQIYVQLIDDLSGKTLLQASSSEKALADAAKANKVEQARVVGKAIGERAVSAGIKSVVFDRNGYLYHGRVKSLADAAREAGLEF